MIAQDDKYLWLFQGNFLIFKWKCILCVLINMKSLIRQMCLLGVLKVRFSCGHSYVLVYVTCILFVLFTPTLYGRTFSIKPRLGLSFVYVLFFSKSNICKFYLTSLQLVSKVSCVLRKNSASTLSHCSFNFHFPLHYWAHSDIFQFYWNAWLYTTL